MNWTRRNGFDNWQVTSVDRPDGSGWTRCNAPTREHEHQSANDPYGRYCTPCVRALLADLRQQVETLTSERDSLDQDLADKEASELAQRAARPGTG